MQRLAGLDQPFKTSAHPNTRWGPHHHLPSLITSPTLLSHSAPPAPGDEHLDSPFAPPPSDSNLATALHAATSALVSTQITTVCLQLPAGSTVNATAASAPARNAGSAAEGCRLNSGRRIR